jgi:pyruvate,water dikinase
LWLDDETAAGSPLLGGKFASLAELMQANITVPHGFGITTAAYHHFIEVSGLIKEVRRVKNSAFQWQLSEIKNETALLRRGIATAPLPPDLEQQIRTNYLRLEQRTGKTNIPVAVRSSGESEDLAGASFAGQYETYLWICGADAVLEHTRACWASMFSEAVLSYQQNGEPAISKGDFGICVGVQQMVQARTAGVMFTVDPIQRDRSKIVLEACWGLGEGVVKGDVTPSQFTLDKVTFEILKRKVFSQPEEYRFNPAIGAVALMPIEAERQYAVCLDDDTLYRLASLAKRIEAQRGVPQDVEWAVSENGDVWILQARPETVSVRPETSAASTAPKSPIAHVLARLSGMRATAPIARAHKS